MRKRNYMNTLTHLGLKMMASQFNLRPSLKSYLKNSDGWINFSIGLKTETGSVEQAVIFQDGKVKVQKHLPHHGEKAPEDA